MPFAVPPFEHVLADAPSRGPLCDLAITDDAVTLGIPELGSATVHRSHITINAPDGHSSAAVRARLGSWAQAQWLAQGDLALLRGSAVAKDGHAIILVGRSRRGASVTAAQLTRSGWGLLSDGFVAIAPDGTVLSGHDHVHLDEIVAERLFADCPQQPLPSGRPRRAVALPVHGDAQLHTYISISVRASHVGVSTHPVVPVTGHDAGHPDPESRMQPLLPRVSAVELPHGRSFVLNRATPNTLEELALVGPPAVAAAILETLSAP